MKRTLVLLKNIKTGKLEGHFQQFEIDNDELIMYLEEGYFDKNYQFIYHWNNIPPCNFGELLESKHFEIGPVRANWLPLNISYDDASEDGYFDLNNGASETFFTLLTDNNYNESYYIYYITSKLNSIPNFYNK